MHATLTQILRALEVVRDGDTRRSAPLTPREAAARAAIVDNAILATLQLAAAVKAAAIGDTAPAVSACAALRLDELEVRS